MDISVVGILSLGLVVGMQHALEADHVAAVSSIVARQATVRRIVTHGAIWGLGHTVTLMLVAGMAVLAGAAFSETLSGWLEFAVGIMLVWLGATLVWRLVRDRVHFHTHRHDDGIRHFHAHSHAGEARRHDPRRHEHEHGRSAMLRSLVIGMVHGMAGSAALLVLTAAATPTPLVGFAYILLFGIGSIAGMAMLSAMIAVPLTWSARYLTFAHGGLQVMIGIATVGLGGHIALTVGARLFA